MQHTSSRWDGAQGGEYHWKIGDLCYRLDVSGGQLVVLTYMGGGLWGIVQQLTPTETDEVHQKLDAAQADLPF